MSRQQARATAAAEVAEAALGTDDTREARRLTVAAYERWCDANAETPWPLTEDRILVYLHCHYPDWAVSYARGVTSRLVSHNATFGHPDPRTHVTRAYLDALGRDLGAHKAPRTPALTGHDVVAVSSRSAQERIAPSGDANVTRLRAQLVTCEALGLNPLKRSTLASVRELPGAAFAASAADVRVRAFDVKAVVAADRDPERFSALAAAVAGAAADARPLSAARPVDDDLTRIRAAVGRELLGRVKSTRTSAAEAEAAWAAASAGEQLKVITGLDPWYRQRVQDGAYSLHGIATGHRHAELKRLTLGHMQETVTGYTHTLHTHKGSLLAESRGAKGQPITSGVDHLDDDPASCPAWCPACALGRHIAVRRSDGATAADRLYVSGTGRPLSKNCAAAILTRTTEGTVEGASTRSMRVTAATLGRQAGMTYEQIREEITHHQSVRTTQQYVRIVEPFSADVTLPIEEQ